MISCKQKVGDPSFMTGVTRLRVHAVFICLQNECPGIVDLEVGMWNGWLTCWLGFGVLESQARSLTYSKHYLIFDTFTRFLGISILYPESTSSSFYDFLRTEDVSILSVKRHHIDRNVWTEFFCLDYDPFWDNCFLLSGETSVRLPKPKNERPHKMSHPY